MRSIGVLGAGAFGTAMAVALARDGRDVQLWARDADAARQMQASRQSGARLPGITLPDSLRVTGQLSTISADVNLLVVPMSALETLLADPDFPKSGHLVACMKGINPASGLTPSGIIARTRPDDYGSVLTGPSFAQDIAQGLPTALTLATADAETGQQVQTILSTKSLRLYRSTDVIGAELGGALKNVIAIAAGVAMGAGLGDSARAAVISRGLAEMIRIGTELGADPRTLTGLSGLGDLVLTATSDKSRNFRAGCALGEGQALPDVTTEGLATAHAVTRLSAERGIDAPISATIAQLIHHETTVEDAVKALIARPLKEE